MTHNAFLMTHTPSW